MNKEKKSSKSKVSWAIVLIVVLLVLVGGGWWLWGKDYLKGAGAEGEVVKKGDQPGKVAGAMPAPGGDEERLAKMEKGEVEGTEAALAQESAKKPPKMIEYKKRLIKDFGPWNSGEDSLHYQSNCRGPEDLDCGSPIGPRGLLVNKEGHILIFDLSVDGGGLKVYDSTGRLLNKRYDSDRPLGIDGKGNIYCLNRILDSSLQAIKSDYLPRSFNEQTDHFVSEDGKLYFLSRDRLNHADKQTYFYECDPFSTETRVDELIAKYNPGWPPRLVIPCDKIDENKAPYFLSLIKTREENKGFFSREDIKNKIDYDPSLTIKLGLLIAVDINNNIYCEFREVRYSEPQVDNYKMGIFNNARELIGYISLCKDSVDLIDPKGRRSRYIYVDYYSGNVYQICTSEAGASLVVWEAEREE